MIKPIIARTIKKIPLAILDSGDCFLKAFIDDSKSESGIRPFGAWRLPGTAPKHNPGRWQTPERQRDLP